MPEITKTRKIWWLNSDTEHERKWHNIISPMDVVSPMVGDLVDILCSSPDWKKALERHNLSYAPVFGNEDYVIVVNLKYESKQSKISIRGFQSRPKTIRRR